MTNKVQKIREEVEKLKSQLLRGACSSQIAMETRCKEEAYNEVLAILDSLQEEPVSEDLEEASLEYWNHQLDSGEDTLRDAFKAGAQWDREKMMSQAIDGLVICDKELTQGYKDIVFSIPKELKVDDKVKMIIIYIH